MATGTSPRAAAPRRRHCHKATQAMNPANSIQANPKSATSWWILIASSETSDFAQLPVRGDAAHVDGESEDGNDKEQFQADMLQVLVAPRIAENQQRQCDHRSDGGHGS